jgi:hypothetical protein
MMTFLPYSDFARSAAVLDNKRLGKQRVEALTILSVLERGHGAWYNHPAVRMWAPYREALVAYGVAITREWIKRGWRDTCLGKISRHARDGKPGSQRALAAKGLLPPWLGSRRFHRSHQSSLVRKNPAYYRRFFPHVPNDLPYVWPTKESE